MAIIAYPIHVHRAAALAAERMLTHLVAGRPPESDAMIPFEHYMDLAGWTEAANFEQSVDPPRRNPRRDSSGSRRTSVARSPTWSSLAMTGRVCAQKC